MSVYSVYESSGPAHVEFTPGAMGQKEEIIAASWFRQLKEAGLIPQNARFGHRIIGYQPPDSATNSSAPIPTYRQALIALVKELKAKANDSDGDGLADFHLAKLAGKLADLGIISQRSLNPQPVQEALLTRESRHRLKSSPPEFTPFCDEQIKGQIHWEPTGFSTRFNGEPFKMREVIRYFRSFAQTHTEAELMQEIAAYLKTYFIHVDQTSFEGMNVSENLGINRNSDLGEYFTKYAGRAVIDCNIFAEVANLILRSLGRKDLSTSFVSVEYFGREKGHVALVVKKDGKPKWLVNNSTITEFGGKLDELVQIFTEDKNHLVSSICTGKTLAASCPNSGTVDPKQALLRSPYATIRSNAAKYLSLNPDTTAVETLVQAARSDKNEDVRYFAVLALLKTGGVSEAQAELLAQDVNRESSLGIRLVLFRLLYSLKKIDQKQYLQFLLETLKKAPNLASFYMEHQLFGLREELRPADRERLEEDPSSLVPFYTEHQLVRLIEEEGSPGYIALADVFENENQYPPLLGNIIIGSLGDRYGPDMKKVKAAGAGFTFLLEKALFRGGQNYAAFYLRELARKGNAEAAAILVKALEHPHLGAAYTVAYSLSKTNVASFMAPPLQERIAAALIKLIRFLQDDPDLLELLSYPGDPKRWQIEFALKVLSDIKGEKIQVSLQRYRSMFDQLRRDRDRLFWTVDRGPKWQEDFKEILLEIPEAVSTQNRNITF